MNFLFDEVYKRLKVLFQKSYFYSTVGVVSLLFAAVSIVSGIFGLPILEVFEKNNEVQKGFIFIIISGFTLLLAKMEPHNYKNLTDVDDEVKEEIEGKRIVEDMMKYLYGRNEGIPPKPDGSKSERSSEMDTFTSYFMNICRTLEKKSFSADTKASFLLDKGTTYFLLGIVLFIFSVIAWQLVSLHYGFQTQFIYGIVSCSILFIVIEFLSGWYFQQYRHFVDNSTYLIKIKSIFDKYMLTFLAIKEFSGSDEKEKNENLKLIVDLLKAEIQWPDIQIMKNSDVNFVKEAITTIGGLAKILKEKNNPDK